MSLLLRRQAFSPSCPSGGTWYSCGSGSQFVGCCNSSPCADGCPDGNLEPASFDPNYYGTFPNQECPLGGLWYTCAHTSPPFVGCCKSDACQNTNGCPVGDLAAGFLSSNPQIAASFETSGSSASTASSSPEVPSTPLTPTTSTTQTALKPSHTGAIVGGVLGGVVLIAGLVALLLLYRRRKASVSKEHMRDATVPTEKPTPMYKDGVHAESKNEDRKQSYSQLTETDASTPAPMYPPSSPLPTYSSSPIAEMDGISQTRTQQSPTQSFPRSFTPSGKYFPDPLGISTSSENQHTKSGKYTAYSTTSPPPVLSPLAQPVVELDGTTSPTKPFGTH